MRFAAAFALATGLLFSTAALAEEVLNAVSFRAIPAGKEISVRALDNSDESIALVQTFKDSLAANGYSVVENARLRLTVESNDSIGSWGGSGDRSVVEMHARGGRTGGEDASVRFNILDTQKGGMLNEGGKTKNVQGNPSEYKLEAGLEDIQDKHRLWQGWIVSDLGDTDRYTLTKSMVPALVGAMGTTVKRKIIKP